MLYFRHHHDPSQLQVCSPDPVQVLFDWLITRFPDNISQSHNFIVRSEDTVAKCSLEGDTAIRLTEPLCSSIWATNTPRGLQTSDDEAASFWLCSKSLQRIVSISKRHCLIQIKSRPYDLILFQMGWNLQNSLNGGERVSTQYRKPLFDTLQIHWLQKIIDASMESSTFHSTRYLTLKEHGIFLYIVLQIFAAYTQTRSTINLYTTLECMCNCSYHAFMLCIMQS